MSVLRLYVNEQRAAREAGINNLYKKIRGRGERVLMITPGADKTVPLPGQEKKIPWLYLKDFSYETLRLKTGDYDNVIIEDTHRLTKEDAQNISRCAEQLCNVYCVGMEYGERGAPNPIKACLSDEEQFEYLPDYNIEQDFSEKIAKASDIKPKPAPSQNPANQTAESALPMTKKDVESEITREAEVQAQLKVLLEESKHRTKIWKNALRTGFRAKKK